MKFIILLSTILLTITIQAQQPIAGNLIQKALVKANKENKKVFIRYTASWCGWCNKMNAALNDKSIKNIFNKHYIVQPIVVLENNDKKKLENPSGDSLLKAQGGGSSGIPYWVVLNNDGTVLANSKNKAENLPLDGDGENVGCPAEAGEIAYFIRVLKASSTLTKMNYC